jgi:hypothetical protein
VKYRPPPDPKAKGREFASRRQADRESLPKSNLTLQDYLSITGRGKSSSLRMGHIAYGYTRMRLLSFIGDTENANALERSTSRRFKCAGGQSGNKEN